MNALALVQDGDMPSPHPLVRYTEQDYLDVAAVIKDNDGKPMEEIYDVVSHFLGERQGRIVTKAAAKNMVNRGRSLGLIPHGARRHKPKPTKGKGKRPEVVVEPKARKPKKFDPGMTGEDLFDFNVQCIYAAQDNMPVAHIHHLNKFRKACEELMEGLTK